MKIKKIAGIILLLLVMLIGTVYVASALAFRDKFLPGTTINGVDVGQMDAKNAQKAVYKSLCIKILLRQGDGFEVINGTEIDYRFTMDPDASSLLKAQNIWLWPKTLKNPVAITVKTDPEYDEAKLDAAIDALQCLHVTPLAPTNAKIVKTDTAFVIEPEKEGTQLNSELVRETILNGIKAGKTTIDLADCYIRPSITKNDSLLVRDKKTLDAITGSTIELDMTGVKEILDGPVLFDWLTYQDKTIGIDEDKLAHYLTELEEEYNTYRSKREFKTHSGQVITVGGGENDTYGFWFDRNKTKAALKKAIFSGVDKTVKAEWKVKAKTRNANNGDIGRTYIEIGIDEQKLWYYQNGRMVLTTPVITGKNLDDTRTPVGVYAVLSKTADSLKIGMDGTSLKSAPYRTDAEFNTETYILNGGDKDVEIPAKNAAKVLSAPEGTPVIIY